MLLSQLDGKVPDDADLFLVEGADGFLYRTTFGDLRAYISQASQPFSTNRHKYGDTYDLEAGKSCYIAVVPYASAHLPSRPIDIRFPRGALVAIRSYLHQGSLVTDYLSAWDYIDWNEDNVTGRWYSSDYIGFREAVEPRTSPMVSVIPLGLNESVIYINESRRSVYYPVYGETLVHFGYQQTVYYSESFLFPAVGTDMPLTSTTFYTATHNNPSPYVQLRRVVLSKYALNTASLVLVHIERLI